MQKKSSANDDISHPKYTNASHGPEGVDKAPGEETSLHPDQFVQETQKGKKVDADPSKKTDRPVEQRNL
jgi:hypothetical protein